MTPARIHEITEQLAEIETACETCYPDDPPWNQIEDAISIAYELLFDAGAPCE